MGKFVDLIKNERYKDTVPDDAACGRAWDAIMKIAEEHALIVQAFGGGATLAVLEEQRKAGVRVKVLAAHRLNEVEGK